MEWIDGLSNYIIILECNTQAAFHSAVEVDITCAEAGVIENILKAEISMRTNTNFSRWALRMKSGNAERARESELLHGKAHGHVHAKYHR